MDDALRVRRLQPVGNLNAQLENLIGSHRLARYPMPEGLALQQFHHEGGRAIVLADIVQGTDVGMVQASDDLRFAFEPCAPVGIGTDLGREYLDGHAAVEAGIAGPIDFTHAARRRWRRGSRTGRGGRRRRRASADRGNHSTGDGAEAGISTILPATGQGAQALEETHLPRETRLVSSITGFECPPRHGRLPGCTDSW